MSLTVYRPCLDLAEVWLPALALTCRAQARFLAASRSSSASAVACDDAFLAYSALSERVRYQVGVITKRGGLLHIGAPFFGESAGRKRGGSCVTTPAAAGPVVSPPLLGEFRKAAPAASRVGVSGAVLPL